MRALFVAIMLMLACFVAVAGDLPTKPVLSFSLTATNENFSRLLEGDLSLRVERDALGWEVAVLRGSSTDNLLYPQRRWHGAFPCQLSAWSYRNQTFPDERVIAVRGVKHSVRIRLSDTRVSDASRSQRFAGGRAEIF